MEVAAYGLALFMVMVLPPLLLAWCMIHPLAAFWRRLGVAQTYLVIGTGIVAWACAVYAIREPVMQARFALNPILGLGGALAWAIAIGIGIVRGRVLSARTLVGVPEVAGECNTDQLITDGIYGVIRHPRYVEGALVVLGAALMTNYLAAWILSLMYVPVIWLVVVLEERELRERFGEAYVAYCARVPRFVPRLW